MKIAFYAGSSESANTVAEGINSYLGSNDCRFRELPSGGFISILSPTYDQIDSLRINIDNIVNLPCKFTTFPSTNAYAAFNDFIASVSSGSSFISLSNYHGSDQLAWANYAMTDTSITTVTGQQAQFARQMMCYSQADFKSRTASTATMTATALGGGNTLVYDGDNFIDPNDLTLPITGNVHTFRNIRFSNSTLNSGQTYSMLLKNFEIVKFKNCQFDLYNGMWIDSGTVDFIVLEDCVSYSPSGYTNATWELRGCGGGRVTNCTATGVVDSTGNGLSKYGIRITNQYGDVIRTNPVGTNDGYRGTGQQYPSPVGRQYPTASGSINSKTFSFVDRRFTDRNVDYTIDVGAFTGRKSGWVLEDNHLTDFNISGCFAFYTDSLYHARNTGGNTRDGWFQYEWVRNIFVNGGDTVIDHQPYVSSPTNTVIGLLFFQENTWITRQNSASALLGIGNNGSPHVNVRFKNCNPKRFRFWHYSVGSFSSNACWWSTDTLVQNCTAYTVAALNNGATDPQFIPNVRVLDNYFNNFGEPLASTNTWNYVGIQFQNANLTASGNVFANNGYFDYRAITDWNNAVPKSTINSFSNTNQGATGYTYYQSASKPNLPPPESFVP